jgi:two-component system OmpR family sensor kinase
VSRSLTAHVTRIAVCTLVGALVVTGLGTAALLHVRARHDLDQSMLAAAYGEAHPWSEERWDTEGAEPPAQVRPWRPGDPDVDEALAAEVARSETPRFVDRDDRRVLVIAFEPPDAHHGDEASHPHQVLVVAAPAVRLADSVGGFVVVWSALTALVGVLASATLGAAIRRAMLPLQRAARDLAALPGLPQGVRLDGGGYREVDVVLRSVNDLLERLETAFEAQTRFTAEAAHELRTPVTVLLGELDLALRREREPAAYREALGRAREEASRLRARVEALMALAKVEAGQASRGRETEYLSALITGAIAAERAVLERTRTEVIVADGPDPELDVHGPLVTLALANLVRNAAFYGGGRPITIRTVAEDGAIAVLVDDQGPGVPPAQREVAFERFRRGTDRSVDGLGLGLPLAREIARRHGGDVTLDDAPGGGCRARLALPHPHGFPMVR